MMAQQPNTTKRGADDDYSLEAVPTTARCHVTESVSKRGMEKVRPGKDGKASHIKGNSERA